MTERSPFFDEMHGFGASARAPYSDYSTWFSQEDVARLRKKSEQARAAYKQYGFQKRAKPEPEKKETKKKTRRRRKKKTEE